MKNKLFFFGVLLVATIADAWLISHPNLMGRLGVWFYHYDFFRSFPASLITVTLTLFVCVVIGESINNRLPMRIRRIVFSILIIGGIAMTVQLFLQFSSGTYKLTGAAFKTGICLFPLIVTLIFVRYAFLTPPRPSLQPKPASEPKKDNL